MGYQEIPKTPQIIGDEDWKLSDRRSNAACAVGLLKQSPEVL